MRKACIALLGVAVVLYVIMVQLAPQTPTQPIHRACTPTYVDGTAYLSDYCKAQASAH